ncbi:MAG TPA: diguanylate cyclase [Spirochaetota bacterium]|nr:diguanylate cyclase [Spirochaetota bacterium]
MNTRLHHTIIIEYLGKIAASIFIFYFFIQYIHAAPPSQKGIFDLRNYQWENGPVALDGEWEFYYGKFYDPKHFKNLKNINRQYMKIPASWSKYNINNQSLPASGFATYRATVLLSNNKPHSLSILIPKLDSSYSLYVNDILLVEVGKPGTTPDNSIHAWKQTIADIPLTVNQIDITIHISNYYYAKAGITNSILLGNKQSILQHYIKSIIVKFFIFGALLFISLYHLALYIFKKNNKQSLYFGIFSLLMALLSIIFGEFHIMLIFPTLPWNILVRITYLTMSLGLTFFGLFIENLYPDDVNPSLFKSFLTIGILYTVLIIISPVFYFAKLLSLFLGIMMVYGLLILFIFARAIKNNRKYAVFFLSAFLIFALAIVNDMLHFLHLINTTYMVPYGFLIFIVFQSFILANQNSRLYSKLEKLFSEKIKLENIAATFQNLAYIDPLTELPNRRRFEEYLHAEWHRAIRNQTPLSILMIDIDYFKKYNDKFGHIVGDLVLKKVGGTIKSCIHRPADMCARYGGEEFIVILPETEIIGAYRIAERIRKKVLDLKLPAAITTSSKFVSVSIGCTTEFPNLGDHWDYIIDKADKKLYQAKKLGRNRTEK